MGEQARVAVITAPSGTMHVSGFLEILAALPEVAQVALVTDGADDIEAHAREHLGTRIAGTYPDADALFAAFQPDLTIVSLEPSTAPPIIAACLCAGSHVLAEKPACLQWEEFAELASLADEQQRNLGLAFAARGFPFLQDARRLGYQWHFGHALRRRHILHRRSDTGAASRVAGVVVLPESLRRWRASHVAGHSLCRSPAPPHRAAHRRGRWANCRCWRRAHRYGGRRRGGAALRGRHGRHLDLGLLY